MRTGSWRRAWLITTVALGTLVAGMVAAGAGQSEPAQHWGLDPAFGQGGIVSTDFPGSGHRLAWGLDDVVQPDGRVVVVGVAIADSFDDAAVARYLPNGTLDPTFGTGGRVIVGPHALYTPRAVAVQEIGGQQKLLVAVSTTFRSPLRFRCSVMRLNPDGTLDTHQDGDPQLGFGHGGIKVIEFKGNSGFCDDLVVTPDNQIVGTVDADRHQGDPGVFRLVGKTGALDPTFGEGGRVTIVSQGFQAGGPVVVQPDAHGQPRYVLGGLVSRAHGYDWALWRLLADGTLDQTFGTGGRVFTRMYDERVPGSFESVDSLALTPDGEILAAGDYRSWPDSEAEPQDTAAVAKYLPDGVLDHAFGANGRAHIPYDGRGNTTAADILLDGSGRILFAGELVMPTSGQFLVGGFRPDGSPDPRFGAAGFLEFRVGGGRDAGYALDVDDRGRLVVAGIWGDPAEEHDRFGVVRLRLTKSSS